MGRLSKCIAKQLFAVCFDVFLQKVHRSRTRAGKVITVGHDGMASSLCDDLDLYTAAGCKECVERLWRMEPYLTM